MAQLQTVGNFLTQPISSYVNINAMNPAHLPAAYMIAGAPPPMPMARKIPLFDIQNNPLTSLRNLFARPVQQTTST